MQHISPTVTALKLNIHRNDHIRKVKAHLKQMLKAYEATNYSQFGSAKVIDSLRHFGANPRSYIDRYYGNAN